MTRNWIATVSRNLSIGRSSTARPSRRRTSICLENLEQRLSLSSFGSKMAPLDLNPQPLPPGYAHVEPWVIQGQHIGMNPAIIAIL
jgi:hypothetical protein